MHYVGKSKISTLYAKRNTTYPQIRLPQQYSDVIGKIAHIFETEHNGDKAFLLVLKEEASSEPATELEQKVLKLSSKVLKPHNENDIESRLAALESSIEELKTLIFPNNGLSNNQTPKEDGLDRIRTGDLRHVKAMSLIVLV